MNRIMGGGDSRLALEIRGDDLERPGEHLAGGEGPDGQAARGVRNARVSREEGRPELAIDVDRPKAAMLGLSASRTSPTASARASRGTQAAFFRKHGNEYPIIVRLREEDRERVEDINDVLINAPSGQVLQAKNLLVAAQPVGADRDPAQEPGADHCASPPSREIALSDAVEAVQRAAVARCARAADSRSASARRSRNRRARSASCS